MVYTSDPPGTTLAGPVFVICTSAAGGFTGVVVVADSLPLTGSPVGELTEAVFTIGFAPA